MPVRSFFFFLDENASEILIIEYYTHTQKTKTKKKKEIKEQKEEHFNIDQTTTEQV